MSKTDIFEKVHFFGRLRVNGTPVDEKRMANFEITVINNEMV